MSDLAQKKCIPCKGGIPGFDITEIHKYLKMVDGWEVKADENKIYYLIKNLVDVFLISFIAWHLLLKSFSFYLMKYAEF